MTPLRRFGGEKRHVGFAGEKPHVVRSPATEYGDDGVDWDTVFASEAFARLVELARSGAIVYKDGQKRGEV